MKSIVLTLAGLYALIMLGMFIFQRSFLYFPDPTRVAPAELGLSAVAEVPVKTGDGQTLIAWWGRAQPGQPTLLYFHGNGGNLAGRAGVFQRHMARGRGVFMMSYRSYSGSSGTPSEASNIADAMQAYDMLVQAGVAPGDIIVEGESLGSGVAVQVAHAKAVAGLILISPYTSIVNRARQIYPWLPVSLLLRDRYESERYIADIKVPLLIVHGDRDPTIPVEMGQRLHELATAPKDIAILQGAGHNDLEAFGAFQVVDAWIGRLRAGASPAVGLR